MADFSYPFGDEPWGEAEWYDFMSTAVPSGVIGSPAASSSSGSLPLTLTGLSWTVGAGSANAGGSHFRRDSAAGGTVAANTNGSNSRRDRIVLRRDLAAKTVTVASKQGTPAGTPVPPSLTRDPDGIWEEPLFSFLVPPASGTGTSDILDERVWRPLTAGADEWVSLTLRSEWGTYVLDGYEPPAVRLEGRRVFFRGWVTNSTPKNAGNYPFLAVPAGLRPANTHAIWATSALAGGSASVASVYRFEMTTAGLLVLHTGSLPDESSLSLHGCSYPLD